MDLYRIVNDIELFKRYVKTFGLNAFREDQYKILYKNGSKECIEYYLDNGRRGDIYHRIYSNKEGDIIEFFDDYHITKYALMEMNRLGIRYNILYFSDIELVYYVNTKLFEGTIEYIGNIDEELFIRMPDIISKMKKVDFPGNCMNDCPYSIPLLDKYGLVNYPQSVTIECILDDMKNIKRTNPEYEYKGKILWDDIPLHILHEALELGIKPRGPVTISTYDIAPILYEQLDRCLPYLNNNDIFELFVIRDMNVIDENIIKSIRHDDVFEIVVNSEEELERLLRLDPRILYHCNIHLMVLDYPDHLFEMLDNIQIIEFIICESVQPFLAIKFYQYIASKRLDIDYHDIEYMHVLDYKKGISTFMYLHSKDKDFLWFMLAYLPTLSYKINIPNDMLEFLDPKLVNTWNRRYDYPSDIIFIHE